MKDQTLDFGDVQIQVREYPNHGEPIIFLHFGGSNLMCWERVVPSFRDEYHVITLDLRGHGKSSRSETGYHIDDFADDLANVIRTLELGSAHIVGCSLGAEVGLSLAANHPVLVRSLTCDGALFNESGPYGHFDGTDSEYKAHAEDKLQKMLEAETKTYSDADARVEASREVFSKYGWWNEWVEAAARYDSIETTDGQITSSWSRPVNTEYTKHFLWYKLEEYYARVKCPLMLLPDDGDMSNPRLKAAVEAMVGFTDKGRLVVAEGWVHPFGWMLDPEPMVMHIKKFLQDIA